MPRTLYAIARSKSFEGRNGGVFIKRVSLVTGVIVLSIVAACFYLLPIKQNASTVQPDPDFGKVKSLNIEKVTIYESGQTKVINRDEKDFGPLADGLRVPVTYSGLFDKSRDGKNIFRLPSLYVPNIDDFINGKVNGHNDTTVIIIQLATPIDMVFANNVAGLPNQFTSLIFLPFDTEYKKVIIFANNTNFCTTIPTMRYDPDLFKDLL
jgi:hypothetical protein